MVRFLGLKIHLLGPAKMARDVDKSALSNQSNLFFPSPIGPLRVSAVADRLVEIKLGAALLPDSHGSPEADEICRLAKAEIEAFLAGERDEFSVPYRLVGSKFQRAVWKEMLRIPYGATLTYGQMAERVGGKGAVRAVGGACGANPLPLLVPCHRVVAAAGLGGFSGGIERKKWLMKLEMTRRAPAPLSERLGGNPGQDDAPDETPRFEGGPSGEQQSLF